MRWTIYISLVVFLVLVSCGKKDRWEVKIDQPKVEIEVIDISKDYYNPENSLASLKASYPFFFDDSVEDTVFENRRKSKYELSLFDSIQKVYENQPYRDDLNKLFTRYKYYFPMIETPTIYVYSSAMQSIYDPVIYSVEDRVMFIALDSFLGKNSEVYKAEKVYPYLTQNMDLANLPSFVVQSIGREIVPFDPRNQSFVSLMIDEGKKLVLADALLPQTKDHLKIGYSPEKYNWAVANEGNIWNYFVEENLVFSTDKSLSDRFLRVAPHSRFMNEVETESPGRIGAWIGWQICKSYLDKKPDVSLAEFINTPTEEIFKESKYKPKKGSGSYTPLENISNDEVKQYEN